MLKVMSSLAVAAAALAAQPAAAEAILGPDAASCRPGSSQPAVLVSVTGFKHRGGRVRVQLYGGSPREFLAKGRKLRRIDLPVSEAGPMNICVAVPRSGNYAVAVRHDADGNGKSGWNDGGGFSRNPNITLASLRPDYRDVAITVGNGVRLVGVVLNYRRGLSVGPVNRS